MNRQETLNRLSTESYDLLIIGGGITGAGVALDAASRGLKVALVEKGDFASGTSSKSTKLIHGGLRYLKQLEISLVREVGQERALLHKLAPHLVIPEKMLLPLIKDGTFGKWATTIGLFTYDLLAGVSGKDKFRMLDKGETMELEPLLPEEKILGSGLYAEYRTDDARLTIEVMKTAARHGALPLNYVLADKLIYSEGKVSGAACKDVLTGKELGIKAKFVVNATGPWSDYLRKQDGSLTDKRMFLTKGVHLVFPWAKLPIKHAIYFDVPDGRMIFAIPRQGIVYVGTTDTPYDGDLDDIRVDEGDISYLLGAVNNMFPSIELNSQDVQASWAGVRPLIYEAGKSASEISRKDEIFESESGLMTIAGGKLTGYRVMAEKITDLVCKRLWKGYQMNFGECRTKEIPLTEKPFGSYQAVLDYETNLAEALAEKGLTAKEATYLVQNYGRQSDEIVSQMKGRGGDAMLEAEKAFTARYEWVEKADDFWDRRSGRRLFLGE